MTDHLPELPARPGRAAGCSTCSTCAPATPGTTTSTSTRSSTSPTTARTPRADHPARHGDVDPHGRPRAARPRPGPFRYSSLATDVLGWVLERAGGAAFPELFSREVWSRIGAEHDAQIMLDRSGFPIVEGGICTTLRDLARFGLMCLEDGAGARRAGRARRTGSRACSCATRS